jgi:PST family polysaccharide transporter
MADGPQRLGVRAMRGMVWAYGSYVGGRALVLVSTAILARLLGPHEFGLVALALVFIGFLETLSDLNLTQALIIQDDDQLEEKADTVWLVSVAMGLGLTIAIGAVGPLAAGFFHQPALVVLMPVLGANQFFRALGSTHYVLAQKRLNFSARSASEFADVIVRAAVGIGLALAGAGAWSLVIGYLVGTLAMVVTLWSLVPWRPHLRFRRAHLRGLAGFGGALTLVGILGAVMGSADDLIVGRRLGTTQLGLYGLAYRLPELLIINLSVVAAQVLFPTMASVSRQDLPAAFLRSLRYGLIVALPLAVWLGVLAEPIVVALFGHKWHDAGAAMQVMALWTLMNPINVIIGTAYKSLGRADLLLKIGVPQAIVLVGSILLVVDHGIVAVSACQAAVSIVFNIIATYIATRVLHVRLGGILRAAWPPVVASLGVMAALIPLQRAIDAPWPAITLGAVAAGVIYPVLLWLVARETVMELWSMVRPGRAAQAGVS